MSLMIMTLKSFTRVSGLLTFKTAVPEFCLDGVRSMFVCWVWGLGFFFPINIVVSFICAFIWVVIFCLLCICASVSLDAAR